MRTLNYADDLIITTNTGNIRFASNSGIVEVDRQINLFNKFEDGGQNNFQGFASSSMIKIDALPSTETTEMYKREMIPIDGNDTKIKYTYIPSRWEISCGDEASLFNSTAFFPTKIREVSEMFVRGMNNENANAPGPLNPASTQFMHTYNGSATNFLNLDAICGDVNNFTSTEMQIYQIKCRVIIKVNEDRPGNKIDNYIKVLNIDAVLQLISGNLTILENNKTTVHETLTPSAGPDFSTPDVSIVNDANVPRLELTNASIVEGDAVNNNFGILGTNSSTTNSFCKIETIYFGN